MCQFPHEPANAIVTSATSGSVPSSPPCWFSSVACKHSTGSRAKTVAAALHLLCDRQLSRKQPDAPLRSPRQRHRSMIAFQLRPRRRAISSFHELHGLHHGAGPIFGAQPQPPPITIPFGSLALFLRRLWQPRSPAWTHRSSRPPAKLGDVGLLAGHNGIEVPRPRIQGGALLSIECVPLIDTNDPRP